MKNEAREISVLVRPYMTNRKVWIDYTLGDWVTIEWDALENTSTPPLQEEVKIIAISQEVDDTGATKVELVFNTRLQENLIRLNQIVDKFTGAGGATPAAQTSSPITGTAILGVSTLNDLTDVIITSPATGAFLGWDGSNWIDVTDIISPRITNLETQPINAQTGTTYTIAATDPGLLVTCNNASAITVTVPQDSSVAFAIGKWVELFQLGAGQITVAAGAGATLRSTPTAKSRAQYSRLFLQKISANTWALSGDCAAT
jgi:hypothetical protein